MLLLFESIVFMFLVISQLRQVPVASADTVLFDFPEPASVKVLSPQLLSLSWKVPVHIVPHPDPVFVGPLVYAILIKDAQNPQSSWKEYLTTSSLSAVVWAEASSQVKMKLVAVGPDGPVASTFPVVPSVSDAKSDQLQPLEVRSDLDLAKDSDAALMEMLGLREHSKRAETGSSQPLTAQSLIDILGSSNDTLLSYLKQVTLTTIDPNEPKTEKDAETSTTTHDNMKEEQVEEQVSFNLAIIITVSSVAALAVSAICILLYRLRSKGDSPQHSRNQLIYEPLNAAHCTVHAYSAQWSHVHGWV